MRFIVVAAELLLSGDSMTPYPRVDVFPFFGIQLPSKPDWSSPVDRSKTALAYLFRTVIGATIALMTWSQVNATSPQGVATPTTSPLAKATYLWHGTVHAQSTYASQELDGSPGTHAWTRKYRVVLLEIPTTSSRGVLLDGNWVSWPLNDLVPVSLEYEVDAYTVALPYRTGPAHGGLVATGAAVGTLSQSQLVKLSSDQYDRVGGTWGDMQRLVAPEAHTSIPSSWTRPGDYSASQGKAMESPGGYDIGFGLNGVDSTDEEKKALYDGITVTHLPMIAGAHRVSLNASEKADLETAGGFVSCMMILEPVHIFGFLERPDQDEVHGSHFYNQHDPEPNYSPPQVLVTWDFKRIPYQPFVQIEYQQKQDGSFVGPLMWFPHNEFVDFLVGHKQAPIDVRIRTIPEDAAIRWAIAPDGNHSGRINPNQGTSKEFSFTPNVQGVRPIVGADRPNFPMIGYTLTVHDEGGSRQLAQETIRQDSVSTLRQEYVDYQRLTVQFGLVPPVRERFGPIEALNGNFTIEEGRVVLYGNYLQDNTTLNGGWRDLALNTQQAYGGVVNLNSAYRNPQRNTRANGAATSIHMTGGAVDMKPVPRDVTHMVALHRAALDASGASEILLERAGGGAGGTILVPNKWRPPPAQHNFTVGRATIVVEDSDGDDLPDRVNEVTGEPRGGIPSATNLPYAGGGTANPPFRVTDSNRNGRIDPLEPLVFVHPLGGVAANTLSRYYDFSNGSGATHVHCATNEKPIPQTR